MLEGVEGRVGENGLQYACAGWRGAECRGLLEALVLLGLRG